MTEKNTEINVSKIDAAIAAAKARKAAKEGASAATEKPAKPAKAPKEPKGPKEPADPKKVKPSKEEREAKVAALKAAREERKAKKAAERAAVAAAKAAAKKPAHVAKLDRAASKLPLMNTIASEMFSEITANLSRAQIDAVAQHLLHWNRVKATEAATVAKLEPGETVRIVGGDGRFVGYTGTVEKAQRIRCYVNVPDIGKVVYLFTSDVEVIVPAATGTEG